MILCMGEYSSVCELWARFEVQKESDFGSDIWPLFLPFLCISRWKIRAIHRAGDVAFLCGFLFFAVLHLWQVAISTNIPHFLIFVFGIIFMFSKVRFGFRLELPGKWDPTLANIRMKLPSREISKRSCPVNWKKKTHTHTQTQTIAFFCFVMMMAIMLLVLQVSESLLDNQCYWVKGTGECSLSHSLAFVVAHSNGFLKFLILLGLLFITLVLCVTLVHFRLFNQHYPFESTVTANTELLASADIFIPTNYFFWSNCNLKISIKNL